MTRPVSLCFAGVRGAYPKSLFFHRSYHQRQRAKVRKAP
jgi:hypothetical protein